MKAANFRYARPSSLTEALRILDSEGPAAKWIAGGQSLGPMLNLRVVQPAALIDVSALAELRRVDLEGGDLVLAPASPTPISRTDAPARSTAGRWRGSPPASPIARCETAGRSAAVSVTPIPPPIG